jgi:hypothetical protein
MKRILVVLLALCSLAAGPLHAQQLEVNTTHELTGKSKRGYLGKVVYDEAAQTTDLIFVTKATDTKVKMEHYYFDKDYKFLRMEEDVIELTKANTKYKWFKYRGENYSKEGITIENNLAGTLVLKRKRTDYTWSWLYGGYRIKVTLLDKVKPRNADGGKYFAYGVFDNLSTGNSLVLTDAKAAKGDTNPFKHTQELEILEVTSDLDVMVKDKFSFDYPVSMIYNAIVTDSSLPADDAEDFTDEQGNSVPDLSRGDLVMVFAPADFSMKKFLNPNPKDYVMVRVNAEGKVVSRVSIPSHAATWNIFEGFRAGNDIYLLGPTLDKKYHNTTMVAGADAVKWEGFQLAKISGSKLEWVTNNNMDDFEARLQTPPSQKRAPAYKGKRFRYNSSLLTSKGEIMVAGQNFNAGNSGISYTDVLLFHFDNQGKLLAQYGGRREENNDLAKALATPQMLFESGDGSKVYWMINEIKGARETTDPGAGVRALIYPNLAVVDVAAAKIGDFTAYGQDDKGKQAYFLHNQFPVLQQRKANALVFLGESKNERVLWFGRIRF